MEAAMTGKRTFTRFFKSYPRHMRQLLALKGTTVRAVFKEGLALPYCSFNVLFFGLLYGLAAVYFSPPVLAQSEATFNPLMVVMVGASVAFLMHAGAALFIWVFCRGIGGSPLFGPVYLGMGAAAIAFWPAVPGLAALQANCLGPVLALFTLAASLYAAAVVYVTIREVSGLSHLKMSIASGVTLVYIGCFMYLWT